MKKAKVSVIIPCYNQAQYLAEALYSLDDQTRQPDEIVIVNDCSPDNTKEVAENLIKELGDRLNIKLINKTKNERLPAARNSGIEATKSEYIITLDCDDKLEPEYIEKCAAVLDKHKKVGIAYTDVQYFGEQNDRIKAFKHTKKDTLYYQNFINCASMFRREAWKQVGGVKYFYATETTFDEKGNKQVKKIGGYEDWEFWIALVEAGWDFQKVEGPAFLYRRRKGTMVDNMIKHDAELRFQIRKLHPKLYQRKHILFIPEDDGAKGYYRIRQFAKRMAKTDKIDEGILDYQRVGNTRALETDHALLWAEYADMLWVQEPMSFEMLAMMRAARLHDRKVIVEFDDDPFHVNPSNLAYVSYGTKDIDMLLPGGKQIPVWRDGQNGFNIKQNKRRLELLAVTIQNADLLVVTTKELADALKELNPNTYILPNYIDMKRWDIPVKPLPHDDIRIVWQGGHSHAEDFMVIRDAVVKLLQKHPKVKLHFYGQGYEAFAEVMPKDKFVAHNEWVHFEAHAYRMLLSGADIAIAPLADNEFNRRKSCIKWAEFSAMGVPVVASDMPPYSPVIKDGETGLLAKTSDDWLRQLDRLVSDAKLRKKIGVQAKEHIKKNWTIDQYEKHWGAIKSLLYD